MKKNKLLISLFSVCILSMAFVSIYATNGNSSNSNSNNGNGTMTTQTENITDNNEITIQNQDEVTTQNEVKTQIKMSEKTSYENRKKEIQGKLALKLTEKQQNRELKLMIVENRKTVNSLKQTLRTNLVEMLKALKEYKNLKDLSDEQLSDINEKIDVIQQVRTVLQEQYQTYQTLISEFRQDSSENKVATLTNIATAQTTRIDILQATIALF